MVFDTEPSANQLANQSSRPDATVKACRHRSVLNNLSQFFQLFFAELWHGARRFGRGKG
jgi:hypothetical protein